MCKLTKMKSINTGLLFFSAIAMVFTTGCNPLNKMNKKHGTVKYTLNPDPLEMHGDSVAFSVSGRYPEKFFNKKAVANVKPVMKDAETGNVVKEFEALKLIGESAEGEGIKMGWGGGSFNIEKTIPFNDNMANVVLEVQVEAGYKTKTKTFDPVPIGVGTITTPLWVQSDEMPILGKDNFTKVSPRSVSAEINYLIQSSVVQPKELKQEDIMGLDAFLEKGITYEYDYKSITITSFASPDGETALNDNLAGDRANSASKAVMKMFKKKKVEAGQNEELYKKMPQGEDWNGFKQKMEASDIADKDMILRILGMYNDDKKREEEIKNLAATYEVIAEEILPQLRRSVISIKAEEKAKTDEELMQITKDNPSELTIEEILYTATLYNDLNKKLEVYMTATSVHPDDWRGHNNVGYIMILQNKVADAKPHIEMAAKKDPSSKVVKNNMGVVTRLMGDAEKAMTYYEGAKGAGAEVNYNIGILNIMDGNYSDAVSNMGAMNTFNSSLAKLLNGETGGAMSTLEASDAKATAAGSYLKAVISARTADNDGVVNNLQAAFAKDASLKAKAKTDMEFYKLRELPAFMAITQ